MKVSFGKIYFYNEKKNGIEYVPRYSESTDMRSHSQKNINDKLLEIFQTHKYDCPNDTKRKLSLEQLLEEKKNADLCIINKRDGSIDLQVRCGLSNPEKCFKEDDSAIVGYIPYDKYDRNRLTKYDIRTFLLIEKSYKKAIAKVDKKLKRFAEKCARYALSPNSKKNEWLEQEYYVSKQIASKNTCVYDDYFEPDITDF